jgi:PKD repeat protein
LGVSFNASGSYDSDGSVTSYAWNFGDGSSGTGATASHTYSNAGVYTARLTVSDNHGATGTVTHSVIVQTPAAPPTPTPSQIDVVITASESEIDILDYVVEDHGWYVELVGHAKNITANTIDYVTIKGRLLDNGGVQLDTTLDMASDVLPNATFAFSMYIWDSDDVETLEIYEITTLTW